MEQIFFGKHLLLPISLQVRLKCLSIGHLKVPINHINLNILYKQDRTQILTQFYILILNWNKFLLANTCYYLFLSQVRLKCLPIGHFKAYLNQMNLNIFHKQDRTLIVTQFYILILKWNKFSLANTCYYLFHHKCGWSVWVLVI